MTWSRTCFICDGADGAYGGGGGDRGGAGGGVAPAHTGACAAAGAWGGGLDHGAVRQRAGYGAGGTAGTGPLDRDRGGTPCARGQDGGHFTHCPDHRGGVQGRGGEGDGGLCGTGRRGVFAGGVAAHDPGRCDFDGGTVGMKGAAILSVLLWMLCVPSGAAMVDSALDELWRQTEQLSRHRHRSFHARL